MPDRFSKKILLIAITILAVANAHATDITSLTRRLDECITHLRKSEQIVKPEQSVSLSQSCAELHRHIHDPVLKQFDPQLRDDTTLGQLIQSKRVLDSISSEPSNDIRLNRNEVHGILNSIYHKQNKPKARKGWVDKLVDWLSRKYNEYFEHDNWFTRNFKFDNNHNQAVMHGLVNSLIVVLILVVIFIVANELRAAGVLGRIRRRRKAERHDIQNQSEPKPQASIELNDIANLPVHRQVPALLRYTLLKLSEARILPGRQDLTNREYLAIVRKKLPGSGREFETLVNQSELIVYGNKPIAAGNAVKLFENVRNILRTKDADNA